MNAEKTCIRRLCRQRCQQGARQQRCHLCPFFAVSENHWRDRLPKHIERHHARTKFKTDEGALLGTGVFVASGTKQLKIIKALYDDDSLYDRMGFNYLQRSADVICRAFVQMPATIIIEMDKRIVLVLDVTGPKYVSKTDSAILPLLRRGSRSFYYTRECANALFNDALLQQGRMKKIRNAAVQRAVQSGNRLWHLLPTNVESWLLLAEGIFTPPSVSRPIRKPPASRLATGGIQAPHHRCHSSVGDETLWTGTL